MKLRLRGHEGGRDQRTVNAAFGAISSPRLKKSSAGRSPKPPARPTRALSDRRAVAPVALLAATSLLLLCLGLAALFFHYMAGRPDPILADRPEIPIPQPSLDEELRPTEQLVLVLPEPPEIIDLSGDPIVVERRQESALQPQPLQLDPRALSALGSGPAYRVSDDLLAADIQLTSGLPASQQHFAFFQPVAGPGEADVHDVTIAAAANPDQLDLLPYQDYSLAADSNTSLYRLGDSLGTGADSGLESRLELQVDEPPAQTLIRNGWSEASAELTAKALADLFGVERFEVGDLVAVRGFRQPDDPSVRVPAQLSLYRGERYVGTVALSDRGDYVEGVDPWLSMPAFEPSRDPAAQARHVRLLDAVYSTALRNNVPAPIVGEAILMLSQAYDLDQMVKAGDTVTMIFSPRPRDPDTGFGKVLYLRIDREPEGIECFVFQPAAGQRFECVSRNGESKAADDGMVTPIRGVLSAKFGPVKDPKTRDITMNTGVRWTAPVGTPVVAAFAGTVVSAGEHPELGNYVEIEHADARMTRYGHLQRIAEHISDGVSVEAGGLLGYAGRSGNASEPQLFFQLLRNGRAVDPFGTYQSTVESGGSVEALVHRIIQIESAGNPTAKNPRSTATGLGQFIESTWLTMIRTHRPDLTQGRTREQILALRTDPDLAREMVAVLARRNAAYLRNRGLPDSPGNLYLAHFLGPEGAAVALTAEPVRALAELFPAAVITANPFLRGWTARDVVDWAARKMRQRGSVPPPVATPRRQYASNERFVLMKEVIDTLVN
jgi:hypothetical protein